VIAASSLFHEIGYHLFSKDAGLISSLESGIILPAVRKEFESIQGFFESKKGYSQNSKDFFTNTARQFVPWELQENSSWFRQTFYNNLKRKDSVLREKTGLSPNISQQILVALDEKIEDSAGRHLSREHIEKVSKNFPPEIASYLNHYANLVYRMSGARVVNAEGHFPQSNLTRLGVSGNDNLVSDDSIFWDIYVESVLTYLTSAAKLTPERLDRLSFMDILKIRRSIFVKKFSEEYDKIIALVKGDISIKDPEKLILKQSEINEAAKKIKTQFSERVKFELNLRDHDLSENALFQVANAVALVSNPITGIVVGCISTLKAIPEITAAVSKPLAEEMQIRLEWIKECINTNIPGTGYQRKALLDGYKEIITYGFD